MNLQTGPYARLGTRLLTSLFTNTAAGELNVRKGQADGTKDRNTDAEPYDLSGEAQLQVTQFASEEQLCP